MRIDKHTLRIETLPSSSSSDKQELLAHVEKIKKYRNECGCSMGAKFLAASIVIFVVYFFAVNDFNIVSMLERTLLGLLFIFVASIIGKLIGIGIARMRLAFLYRSVMTKFPDNGG